MILCALGIMISYADPWSGQDVVSACDFFHGGFLEVLQTQFFCTKTLFGFPMDNDKECLILDFRFGNALVQTYLPVCEHPSVPLFGAVSVMENSSKDRVFFSQTRTKIES